jgi:hypothetical protein
MRRDAKFCSGTCQVAHFRARAGAALPFISAIPGIDDDPAAEAAVQALVAPFKHLWSGDLSPEAAMAEVHQAEQRLLMARRAAKKVYKKAGLETGGMFDGPFVLRETAEAVKPPVSDPPKYESSKVAQARGWATLREEEESKLVPREPQDMAAREAAVAAKFKASTPEQQAAMISAAAKKGVRLPTGK